MDPKVQMINDINDQVRTYTVVNLRYLDMDLLLLSLINTVQRLLSVMNRVINLTTMFQPRRHFRIVLEDFALMYLDRRTVKIDYLNQ